MTIQKPNPIQMRTDIDEIVNACASGGRKLADITYKAIVSARRLTRAEAAILAGNALTEMHEREVKY